MKKKQSEIIEWNDLKVGDFIESEFNKMFCFKRDGGMLLDGPSCLGINKFNPKEKSIACVGGGVISYQRMKPTKTFIKLCKKLLNINHKEYRLDNLSYIEALAALKKYDTNQ